VKDWQSEPYNKNQNYAERGWRDSKAHVNNLLNYTGAPAEAWLLALQYVCFVMNHTAHESLGWRTPIEWLLGFTPDISVLLEFIFWQPVYYLLYDKGEDNPEERLGRFVGISENVGHSMTFKILSESNQIIHRASVRSAMKGGVFHNAHANMKSPNLAPKTPVVETVGESDQEGDREQDDTIPTGTVPEIITSAFEDDLKHGRRLPTINVEDIVGRTFITLPDNDDKQHRATIYDVVDTHESTPDGE